MGEISEMMLDGTLCSQCGVYIDDEVPDHPRKCSDCAGGRESVVDYRKRSTKAELEKMGCKVLPGPDAESYSVWAHGKKFNFWPYKGWFAGPTKGRGFRNLVVAIKQLERNQNDGRK